MISVTWTDTLQAIGTALTPIVVAWLAFVLTRAQSRSSQLLSARLEFYKQLIPDLNKLMCYMTFIGTWRDQSPPEILQLKRRLDEHFFCAAPLFSPGVSTAYNELMELSFATFGAWGSDARIRTNAYRRRQAWRATAEWDLGWDVCFELGDRDTISGELLQRYRDCYDALVAGLVRDLDMSRARTRYTTDEVSLNAHAPHRDDVLGLDA
jgi:hypothetical protein